MFSSVSRIECSTYNPREDRRKRGATTHPAHIESSENFAKFTWTNLCEFKHLKMTNANITQHEQLLNAELEEYKKRTVKSSEMYTEAQKTVPGGVASDYQVVDPYPFYVQNSNEVSCQLSKDNGGVASPLMLKHQEPIL